LDALKMVSSGRRRTGDVGARRGISVMRML
jgi:hypothetical protein